MEKVKKQILITNDDGIDSPGIYALAKALSDIGDVIVVAPDSQKSAVSHSMSIINPLRTSESYRDGRLFGYSVNGSPADCVKLALCSLLPKKPDLVVSGINHGANTSVNILYSGTVAGAAEGMLAGIPSMAISLASYDINDNCNIAAKYGKIIANILLGIELPKGTFLNVNVPNMSEAEIKGIRITRESNSVWTDKYEMRKDPFGKEYYWFAGEYVVNDHDIAADDVAIALGYVSVTPLKYDLTNTEVMKDLAKVFVKK